MSEGKKAEKCYLGHKKNTQLEVMTTGSVVPPLIFWDEINFTQKLKPSHWRQHKLAGTTDDCATNVPRNDSKTKPLSLQRVC